MRKQLVRVLLSKFHFDVHDRGIRVIAKELRDAGMEVIYLNYSDVRELMNTAIQEDVHCICLSFLAGGEDHDVPRLLKLLKRNNMGDLPVILGGMLPQGQPEKFLRMGVKKYFGPGTSIEEIVEYLSRLHPGVNHGT